MKFKLILPDAMQGEYDLNPSLSPNTFYHRGETFLFDPGKFHPYWYWENPVTTPTEYTVLYVCTNADNTILTIRLI